MTPDYRQAGARKLQAIELYRQGLTPAQISQAMGVARTTVWRYLHGTPKLHQARAIPVVSELKRPPYWELHTRGGAVEVVCGRKFCAGCGRWRHLLDFGEQAHKKGAVRARCATCENASRRYYDRQLTPDKVANRRERHRIYYEGKRRAAGIQPTTARRSSAIDQREAIYFPVEPLLEVLSSYEDGEFANLAAMAGVPERTIYRFRSGESHKVQIDVADKLATALGVPSAVIWAEQW